MSDSQDENEIIDLWIDSNVYGKEGLEKELENLSTARLSTTIIEIYSAISQGNPPQALVERLAEIAGVQPDEFPFDELLEKARQAAHGGELEL